MEFPSQILEHWLSTPEVLSRFAVHYQTGQPIPKELVAKIERATTFNQGFDTVEYLASALVDMKLHLAGGTPIDPDAFERDTLKALGMPEEIVMRHRTPQFSHIFAGDGYSAGYYSYLWSDTLTADAWEAFTAPGGPYDPAWRSGCATTSSRSGTPSIPPTPTARSAAGTPGSTPSCASAASRCRRSRRPTDRAGPSPTAIESPGAADENRAGAAEVRACHGATSSRARRPRVSWRSRRPWPPGPRAPPPTSRRPFSSLRIPRGHGCSGTG